MTARRRNRGQACCVNSPDELGVGRVDYNNRYPKDEAPCTGLRAHEVYQLRGLNVQREPAADKSTSPRQGDKLIDVLADYRAQKRGKA
jgi:hypothetical protein